MYQMILDAYERQVFRRGQSKNYWRLEYRGAKPADEREALAVSIAKWLRIYKHVGWYPKQILNCGGIATCGLCLIHFETRQYPQKPSCGNCLIAVTWSSLCKNTPYSEALAEAQEMREDLPERLKTIWKEVGFLLELACIQHWLTPEEAEKLTLCFEKGAI